MSTTKKTNTNAAVSSPELHKTNDQLDALDAIANEDDVTFSWRVEVIRGANTVFLDISGSSTNNRMLAPENLGIASHNAEEEILNKVVRPVMSAFQAESNRRTLEIVAAQQHGDLGPLT